MKKKILTENDPLKVEETFQHFTWPGSDFNEKPHTTETRRTYMLVFTDGEIAKEEEPVDEPIDEYLFSGKRVYRMAVDTLRTRDVYFKNHSYVITITIADRFLRFRSGNGGGWFDYIEDAQIYVKDPKDIKALFEAKKAVRDIKANNSDDYSYVYRPMFGSRAGLEKFQSSEVSDDIYSIKRR